MTPTPAPSNDVAQLETILRRIEADPPDAVRARERGAFDDLAGPLGERLVSFDLIRSIAPEYHVFSRRYAEECWEGFCYAIPKHRLKRA